MIQLIKIIKKIFSFNFNLLTIYIRFTSKPLMMIGYNLYSISSVFFTTTALDVSARHTDCRLTAVNDKFPIKSFRAQGLPGIPVRVQNDTRETETDDGRRRAEYTERARRVRTTCCRPHATKPSSCPFQQLLRKSIRYTRRFPSSVVFSSTTSDVHNTVHVAARDNELARVRIAYRVFDDAMQERGNSNALHRGSRDLFVFTINLVLYY